MSLPDGGAGGGINLFWGAILSVAFHVFIFLLIIFWGFGSSNYSAQPNFIEGRLVSLSELGETGSTKRIEPPKLKEEAQKQPKKEEKKVVEEPKNVPDKEEPKKAEKPVAEPKKAEKEIKTPPKTAKKEEKKEEPEKPEEQKSEEPKDKNVVALETKKEVKKTEKKPKPTKAPEPTRKKAKPDLENAKSRILKDIQENVREEKRRGVLEELQQEQSVTDQKVMAKADSTEKSGGNPGSARGKLSAGARGGGTNAVVTNLFLDRIRNEIREHYKIPPNIPTDGKLETFIFFKINESGKVYDVRVDESSGNPAFDDLCVKAIYKSVPLTPPPPELMEQAKTVGFLIPFTNDPF